MWGERREGRLANNITMDAVCVGGGPPALWSRSADDAGWVGKEGGGGVSVCDSTRKEGGREQPDDHHLHAMGRSEPVGLLAVHLALLLLLLRPIANVVDRVCAGRGKAERARECRGFARVLGS